MRLYNRLAIASAALAPLVIFTAWQKALQGVSFFTVGVWIFIALNAVPMCLTTFKRESGFSSFKRREIVDRRPLPPTAVPLVLFYLSPFLVPEMLDFFDGWLPCLYVAFLFLWAFVLPVKFYYLNPTLHLMGYRFFRVTDADGAKCLLFSHRRQGPVEGEILLIPLFPGVCLRKDPPGAPRTHLKELSP